MASSSKSRQPRLRASCDGCFLAKVKCSKARPICSRCLACGIECRYSPSSRAGKPKAENIVSSYHNNQSAHDYAHTEGRPMVYTPPFATDYSFGMETGWSTPPDGLESAMSRTPSASTGLSLLGSDGHAMAAAPDMYAASVPWTPPNDINCGPYSDTMTATHLSVAHMRSQSLDMSMSPPMMWPDTSGPEMPAYNQALTPTSIGSKYFPSPTATPTTKPAVSRHKSAPTTTNGGSCTCFTVCLQSLQALHNASTPEAPPFDLVLTLNRKAVEGCAAMLACTRCLRKSGTHTATMLLATLMGKITTFYKNATHSHFDGEAINFSPTSPTSVVGVSFGTYHLDGEDGRWLEIEILTRELRKLEELYARFSEVCSDLADNPEVSRAMIEYLGQSLGHTLEIVNSRRQPTTFS